MTTRRGCVYLVGAGPGDPEFITVCGHRLLRRADVVVYDRLVSPDLLALVHPRAELIAVGKTPGRHALPQDEINQLLVRRAGQGAKVVRLKGGDPFVFGRGSEELDACRAAGVSCRVVPGVSSALAGPLSAGIPITERGVARSFAVITARGGVGVEPVRHDYSSLARVDTLIVLMGCASLAEWSRDLIHAGKSPETPAAVIASATLPNQQVVSGTLAYISQCVDRAGVTAPMVVVVGEVARRVLAEESGASNPLRGQRVLLTGTPRLNRRLAAELVLRGAYPIIKPLIRIAPITDDQPLRAAIQDASHYAWIVFTSRYGVVAFFRTLARMRLDSRALGKAKLAVVGRGTAQALARRGLRADLVATPRSADGLVAALLSPGQPPPRRVLHPRSSIARPELAERLRRAGVVVDDPIAYTTTEVDEWPGAERVASLTFDVVVLCSPSAARAYARLCLDADRAMVATIGSTTANAARALGLNVAVIAEHPSPSALVDALVEYVCRVGVRS